MNEQYDSFKWVGIMFSCLFLAMAVAFSVQYYSGALEVKYATDNGYEQVIENNRAIWKKVE